MTTGTKTIVGLYHEADEALWQELQLHLNLLARQHPEYSWQSLPLPLHELSGEKLKDAALLVLGISVDFLNALYLEQHRLLATLKTLSQTCRGP